MHTDVRVDPYTLLYHFVHNLPGSSPAAILKNFQKGGSIRLLLMFVRNNYVVHETFLMRNDCPLVPQISSAQKLL